MISADEARKICAESVQEQLKMLEEYIIKYASSSLCGFSIEMDSEKVASVITNIRELGFTASYDGEKKTLTVGW